VTARDGDSRGETTAIRKPNHHPTNRKGNTVYQVHLGIVITLGPVRSGPVFSHWHLERSSYGAVGLPRATGDVVAIATAGGRAATDSI